MRHFLFLPLFFLLFLASCEKEKFVWPQQPGVGETADTVERMVIVYMMAENSLNDFSNSDESEIKRGVELLSGDSRVFAFIDDKHNPRIMQYTPGEAIAVKEYEDDFCSSDTAALKNALQFLLVNYPTKHLDLVLWSHGDGWLRGESSLPQRSIGVDNGKNSYSDRSTDVLEIEEIATVLDELPVKVDRLMFDACFMQSVEVAYALRNSASWIIASPAEIPADGAPYDKLLPLFFDTQATAGDIINEYVAAYSNEASGVVLSAINTAHLVEFAAATSVFVSKYFPKDKKRAYIDVFSYLPGGKRSGSKIYPCYYDFNAIMKKYLAADEYAEWKRLFDEIIPFAAASDSWYSAIIYRMLPVAHDVCGAVSLYMPQNGNSELNAAFSSTEWYGAAGWKSAGW